MTRFLSPLARSVTPYTPGEQPRERMIKLNTNERPYGPSPAVAQAIAAAAADLNLYPPPDSPALREAAARFFAVDSDQVFVGNGSDEVLFLAFQAYFDPERPVARPDISYSFYPVYCRVHGLSERVIPLREDLSLPVESFFNAPGGVVLANPNAPTAQAVPRADIAAILENNPDSVVLVDEAYAAFGGQSAAELIDRYDNLLIITTLSKSHGLAGLRVGFALGQAELLGGLVRMQHAFNSYPVDRLAQAAATAALEDVADFEQKRDMVLATRAWFGQALGQLGFEFAPPAANFVFARHPGRPARELFASLRQRGILVRHFDAPRVGDHLRITIGTDAQMRTVIDAFGEILNR